jgi:hypothetical protein
VVNNCATETGFSRFVTSGCRRQLLHSRGSVPAIQNGADLPNNVTTFRSHNAGDCGSIEVCKLLLPRRCGLSNGLFCSSGIGKTATDGRRQFS